MDDEHEWNAPRDIAHLTAHAGARQPCCEPILARISTLSGEHMRVLQVAYFRRAPGAQADIPFEVGCALAPKAAAAARSITGPDRQLAEGALRVKGDAALRAATAAYEGRAPDPPRLSDQYGRDRTRERTIYFVRGEGTGLIKIGVADDLDRRLAGLRTHSPVALSLLATRPGNHRVERLLHEQFAHLRAHGEWFREAPDLLAYIAALAVGTESGGAPPEST